MRIMMLVDKRQEPVVRVLNGLNFLGQSFFYLKVFMIPEEIIFSDSEEILMDFSILCIL